MTANALQPPAPEALYEVIRQVRPLFLALSAAVDEQLSGTGITIPMRAVLEELHRQGARTVPQIGRALSIQRQFIQRIADHLRRAGYIERLRNPEHKRSWLLALTEKGTAAIEGVLGKEREVLIRVAPGFGAEDVAACHEVLARMVTMFTSDAWRPGAAGDEGVES